MNSIYGWDMTYATTRSVKPVQILFQREYEGCMCPRRYRTQELTVKSNLTKIKICIFLNN